MIRHEAPDLVPVLSKGKHRSPRKGACFMEYASFLAGERWSDHPRCTHPLLAGVARAINDHLSDASRSRLVPLVPSVVGLNGSDPRADVGIATRCAAVALPVAAEPRQRALATGLLAGRLLLWSLDEQLSSKFDAEDLFVAIDQALTRAPDAARWAERFVADLPIDPEVFRLRSAPSMVRVAVTGISEACISDPDSLLYELLQAVIDDCTHWFEVEQVSSEAVANLLTERETVSP